MKGRRFAVALFVSLLLLAGVARGAGELIVDHRCTDIREIPESAIEAAKADLHIAYGHTSHGSQLINGMGRLRGTQLDEFMTANGATPGLYLWNDGGTDGALDLRDEPFEGARDLGNPDRTSWETATRNYLADNPEINVIIWSWCGQADTTTANIDTYLDLMEGLIDDYPDVHFVFMTGHLVGTGEDGQLHKANEHIREHCRDHGRILYDFADIESYDPDGQTNYMELMADDNCDYDSDGNGTRDRNWALDWQNSHTEGVDWWASGAAHSQDLNGNLKGYAAWWLWARLAGWGETCTPLAAPTNLTAVADADASEIALVWTDNSDSPNEDSFVVARRVGGGTWVEDYVVLSAGATAWTDTGLAPGTYTYRIVAHSNEAGDCDSPPSNVATASIPETPPPLTGPVGKLKRVVVVGGKKRTGYTVRVDARVKGNGGGCRIWEILDGVEPPEFVPGEPVDGVLEGLTVTLSDDPELPAKRKICVQIERGGEVSNVKAVKVTLVAPKVKKASVRGGKKPTDPALLLDFTVKRDAVGYRVWEDLPGAVPPAFTMEAPVDGGCTGVPLTLSTEAGLKSRRTIFIQVTGEATESKVKKLVVQLR